MDKLDYIRILKPYNWIKNMLIALPIYFNGYLFESSLYPITALSIIATSLASSAGYIINDILDIEEDKHHPYKRNRPFASGRVPIIAGYIISILLAIVSIYLDQTRLVIALLLFDMIYNFKARDIPILDIVVLSSKYPIRAYIGYIIINKYPNIFLLLSTFLVAVILAIFKRKGEIGIYNRSVMKYYNKYNLDLLMSISTISLIVTLIALFYRYKLILLASALVILYMIFYYISLDYSKSKSLAILKDKYFLVLLLCLGISSYFELYGGV